MAVSLLTPRSLTDTVNKIITPQPIVLDLLFKNRKLHTAENVDIPIKKHQGKLARFVNRGDAANVVVRGDREIKTLKLPSIREKEFSKAATVIQNLSAGEGGIYQDKDRMEVFKMDLAEELLMFKNRCLRTMEWMACQAVQTGVVTVAQENVAFTIDFGIASSHKITLSGAAQWDEATADIVANIRNWKRLVLRHSGGAADIGLLGADAADRFVTNDKVLKQFDTNNNKVGSIDQNSGSNYLGRAWGIDWYEVDQAYTDEAGSEQNMFDPARVVIANSKAPFARNFGPCSDLKAGLKPNEFFSKSWEVEDPSGTWLLVETNPLPAPHDPDALVSATVL